MGEPTLYPGSVSRESFSLSSGRRGLGEGQDIRYNSRSHGRSFGSRFHVQRKSDSGWESVSGCV